MQNILFRFFVVISLAVPLWTSTAYAQQLHSEAHEEREDRRQEDVVQNMHFADDVLKNKFIDIYVPYQERLFKTDHALRDLVGEYQSAQSNGQVIPGPKARELLTRGVRLQRERNENFDNYIGKLSKAMPGGVALQAWLVENKLRAATSTAILNDIPFVTQ
jgi:hypothetical protein